MILFIVFVLSLQAQTSAHSFTADTVNRSPDQSDELKLIEGLRSRRLFELAESQTRKQLAKPNLTPTAIARLTNELIKTQTARALFASDTDRESSWKALDQTATDFLATYPDHPRRLLVEVQIALSDLAHGQQLRQELAAEIVPESSRELALTVLRKSNSRLNEINRAIETAIPDHRGRTLGPDELTVDELMALGTNVRYQLAVVNTTRARLYPTDDRLNRVDALHQVLQRLTEVQRETAADQPLWWDSQILQMECLISLNEWERAAAVEKRLRESLEDKTEPIPPSLLEQQLNLFLATDNRAATISALQQAAASETTTPELDLARMESIIGLAQTDSANRDGWLSEAVRLSQQIESRHGPYWSRRAKLILIEIGSTADFTHRSEPTTNPATNPNLNPNIDPAGKGTPDNSATPTSTSRTSATSAETNLLIELAEQALRKENYPDAIKAFSRAASLATQLGDAELALVLGIKEAQVFEQQRQHESAANRLLGLAVKNADSTLAPATHLRGCWNLAQTISMNPANEEIFTRALSEHLQRWPSANTAAQVQLWLGGQLQKQQQWQSAFSSYILIPAGSEHFSAAIPRAVYSASRWLETESESRKPVVAAQVIQKLSAIHATTKPLSPEQELALLALAEWGIKFGLGLNQASSVSLKNDLVTGLRDLIATSENTANGRTASAWLLALLISDPDAETESEKLFAALAGNAELLGIVEAGIRSTNAAQFATTRTYADQWRLKIIEAALAGNTTMSAQAKNAWRYRKSEVLIELGQHKSALEELQKLQIDFPNDAGIQLRIARQMSKLYASNDPAKPLANWRKLTARLKPHSEPWFESKYETASLLLQSGEKEAARKLLEYLKTIPPGWEQSPWRDQLEALLKKCQ